MFGKKQREQINGGVNIANSGLVKDGETVTRGGKKTEVPNIFELRKQAIDKLCNHGFTVKGANPSTANVIIRVYSDKNLQFGANNYWAYGVEVFVKRFWKMRSTKCERSVRNPFRNYVSIRLGPNKTVIKNIENFVDYHFMVTK